jgi:CheY-like chemotaxis protein
MIAIRTHDPSKTMQKGSRVVRRNPGILIADDMGLILTLLKFEFESWGFAVWLAVDGDDALDLYRRNRTEIDLVLLDVDLPGLDGPHTLAALQRIDPNVLACFMRANIDLYADEDLRQRGGNLIFDKPFRTADVVQGLRSLLEIAGAGARPDHFSRVWRNYELTGTH